MDIKYNLDITETSEMLGVSNTTIKNWVKQKHLFPTNSGQKNTFSYSDVNTLKKNILNGSKSLLTKRANKRNSNKVFIPKEYNESEYLDENISAVISHIIKNSLEPRRSVFFLALNILIKSDFILSKELEKILKFDELFYKNTFILNILEEFYSMMEITTHEDLYHDLLNFNIPTQNDTLGLLYQSIKSEGDKAKEGSYYTPTSIVNEIIRDYIGKKNRILDPCCGTGQFLLSASNYIENPNKIHGFDIDLIAVFIAKINLILKYKTFDFSPNITHKDSLLESKSVPLFNKTNDDIVYDLITTNPPWGLHHNNDSLKYLKSNFPQIKSLESFSYFLSKSIDLLEVNGILSFVLPESILNIKVHKDIRKIILEKTTILKIVKLGRAFSNVFTNVIRIDLQRSKPEKHHKIEIISDSNYSVEQERFWRNSDIIFDVDVNSYDEKIISKVFKSDFSTLKNNAEWALGIVTGNNKKFLLHENQDGSEIIFKGKDISKYHLQQAQNFIHFEPNNFQQVAPEEKYRAKEKLIYKFISSKLVFAYDNEQRLTLNSANILIPQIKNYPIKIVLALLNSSLYQFVYLKKFNTIKVLRGNIEELPFPKFSEDITSKILCLVDDILIRKKDITCIDNLIMEVFNITKSEKEYILEAIS